MSRRTAQVIEINNNTLRIIGAVTGEQLRKAAIAGGQVIEARAKINVEKTFSSKSTGGAGLAGSIQTTVAEATSTHVEVDVGPTVIYGRIQELGGVIVPVFKKMLSWVSDTGERIFAFAVTIPARPYLRPAADESEDDILDAVRRQIKGSIERAAS